MLKPIGIILIYTLILYGNTFNHEYVLDDRIVVTENEFVKDGFKGIPDILGNDTFYGVFGDMKELSGGRYRPLSLVTFAIEYQFFGLNPHLSHVINTLLYALCGILIYVVTSKLFKNQTKIFPLLISLLFLAHPTHTEAIANIKSRDEIMSMLGSLFTLYLYIRFWETSRKLYLIYSSVVFFLALLSKENTITFLAVISLVSMILYQRNWQITLKDLIPLVVSTSIYVVLRFSIVGQSLTMQVTEIINNPFVHASLVQKYSTIVFCLGLYIKLLLYPHPLSHDYSFNEIKIVEWTHPWVLVSLFLYLLIIIWALIYRKKQPLFSFSILYYIITLSVVSNIFVLIGATIADRFLFMPSLGFVILLAWGIIKLFKKIPNKTIQIVVVVFLLLPYSIKTISRNALWKNEILLFKNDVFSVPNCARVYTNYATTLIHQADTAKETVRIELLNKTEKALRKSISIYPRYSGAYLTMAVCMSMLGRFNEAHSALNKVEEFTPGNSYLIQYGAFVNNAEISALMKESEKKVNEKDFAGAVTILEKVVLISEKQGSNPAILTSVYVNLGGCYFTLGKYDMAKEVWNKAILLDSTNQDVQRGLKALSSMTKPILEKE